MNKLNLKNGITLVWNKNNKIWDRINKMLYRIKINIILDKRIIYRNKIIYNGINQINIFSNRK